MFLLAMLPGIYHATGQTTVDGVKFSTCLNNKYLPAQFYKGKFLVLDFWATWCGPCIASFPKVSALQKKYDTDSRIVFAAITTEREGLVDSFFHRKKDMMPGVLHLIDDSAATWQYFEVSAIPQLIVFSPSGKIVFSGRAEELSTCMDKLLQGVEMYAKPKEQPAVVDKWKQYQQTASFIAIAGPGDTTQLGGSISNTNTAQSAVFFSMRSERLTDVLGAMGKISSVSFAYNDSVKANQRVTVCYKQIRNDFPSFNSGIFGLQYQNHFLNLLENVFSFHSEWIKEKVTAYKIVVKDKALLAGAASLSTHGSSESTIDPKKKTYTYVNQQLKFIAAIGEDYLGIPFFTDDVAEGYDVDLTLSSLSAFELSLAQYGLALKKTEGYEIKKLKLTFY